MLLLESSRHCLLMIWGLVGPHFKLTLIFKSGELCLQHQCGPYMFLSTYKGHIDHGVLLPRFRSIEVPHVNQLYNWDCGLACVMMVLQTIGIHNCSLQALEKLCDTQSADPLVKMKYLSLSCLEDI